MAAAGSVLSEEDAREFIGRFPAIATAGVMVLLFLGLAVVNGLFTFVLGLGYLWAAKDIDARRGYMWIAGVFAKGAGSLLFLYDHFARESPDAFLVFAATDGTLALLTLALLRRTPVSVPSSV